MRGDVIQPAKQNIFSPLCPMFRRWSRPTLRILSDFGPFLKLLRNFSRGIKKSQLKIQSLRMNRRQGGLWHSQIHIQTTKYEIQNVATE